MPIPLKPPLRKAGKTAKRNRTQRKPSYINWILIFVILVIAGGYFCSA